eukprot:3309855-Rhodomonas_salina.1
MPAGSSKVNDELRAGGCAEWGICVRSHRISGSQVRVTSARNQNGSEIWQSADSSAGSLVHRLSWLALAL